MPPEPESMGRHIGASRELILVDDDLVFSGVLGRALSARGFRVRCAGSVEGALSVLDGDGPRPDFAILDLNLPGASGLQLIGPLREHNAACRIVLLTGYASIPTAVGAIKLGADEYLAKPVEVEAIVRALVRGTDPDTHAIPEEPMSVPRIEWEHIQRVLTENGGNISATARALKMHRRTLQRKLLKRPQGA